MIDQGFNRDEFDLAGLDLENEILDLLFTLGPDPSFRRQLIDLGLEKLPNGFLVLFVEGNGGLSYEGFFADRKVFATDVPKGCFKKGPIPDHGV